MSSSAKLAELQAELAEIKEAIKKAQKVQSYTSGGVSVAAGNLSALYKERDRIQAAIDSLTRGNPFKAPVFRGSN